MYEVYALKYGERDTTACQFFYREASHESITLHYYVWLILGGPHPILVDTGFLDDDARERGIRSYVSPAAMVERAGVKPGDVPVALITHLHYDHWAGSSPAGGRSRPPPTPRPSIATGRRPSPPRSSRACPRCSRPPSRSTRSPAPSG